MTDRLSNLDVLSAVQELQLRDGLVPTVRELGLHLGVTGPSVQRKLNALVADGYLTRKANQPRTLALTPAGRSALS
jgi:DNA-binding MarR family transcriptional regulator